MLRREAHIQFAPPAGWVESTEGTRLVYAGPNGEELVVNVGVLTGAGSGDDLREVRQVVIDHHLNKLQMASTQEGLVPVVGLYKDTRVASVDCWAFVSRHIHDLSLLMGAFAVTSYGALLITLAGPDQPSTLEVFMEVLATISEPAC